MQEVELAITEVVISYMISNESSERKTKLIMYALANLPPVCESRIFIEKLNGLCNEVGDWPSLDFVVSRLGYSGKIHPFLPNMPVVEAVVYIEKSIEDMVKRSTSDQLMEVAKNVETLSIKQIEEKLSKIKLSKSSKDDSTEDEFSARASYDEREKEPAGLLTFINAVDSKIGGVRKGTQLTICGSQGHFKTMTGLSLLYRNAVYCKKSNAFLSFEMPKEILKCYLLSRHSYNEKFAGVADPVAKEKIIDATLSEKEKEFIFDVVEPDLHSSEHGRMIVLDRSDFKKVSFSGIKIRLGKIKCDLDGLLVDYIQRFRYVNDEPGLSDPANQYADFFMDLALDFEGRTLSMVLLSQANREGLKYAQQNNGKYELYHLAEINALDRNSAYALFTYTDPVLRDSSELKICVPKNRYGDIIAEPITTYVNPQFCVVGEQIQGAGEQASTSDFSSLLLGGSLV